MTQKEHVPLGVGFYPDWWYQNYGLSFGRQYYFDPEERVRCQAEMARRLHERFGELGLGHPDPPPKPLITFGMVMLPALLGCEVVFEDGALPWALPRNLSKEECLKLRPPDLYNDSPMKEIWQQIEHLKNHYGRVVGDINVTGVQNLALKLRGEELYIDYFEDPDFAHTLLKFCAQCVLGLWQAVYPVTGSGALDVTPMADPSVYVVPNCTVEQISGDTSTWSSGCPTTPGWPKPAGLSAFIIAAVWTRWSNTTQRCPTWSSWRLVSVPTSAAPGKSWGRGWPSTRASVRC